MNEKIKGFVTHPYIKIVACYFLAHFFMLILSGCWWDDWTFMTHDLNYVSIVASESGRPEWNLLVPFCWSLSNNGRILIFFLYLFISIFVFEILRNSSLFNENESLAIAMLFSAFPVDEARILISNFAYTVGLFFFYFSFMLFVIWNGMDDASKKKRYFRILILLSFFTSFILNSVLAYYYILIAYLFVLDVRKNEEKNVIKKVLISVRNVLFHYPDFFILPFLYYGMNKTFFPTYGETFGSYNSVSLSGLIKCFAYVPVSMIKVFKDVFEQFISNLNLVTIFAVFSVVLVHILIIKTNGKNTDRKSSLLKLLYGIFVLAMGIFPYVMVRGRAIDTIGVKGRDAVLTPFGAAIILCSLIGLLKYKMRTIIFSVLLTMEIICFNSLYIEWQKDYYYQLSFQKLMNNNVIRDNDTFFVADLNETKVEGQRYYSFNALSYFLFGDETRFFVPKVSNLYILENEKYMKEAIEVLGYSHLMRDYAPEDYCFDAILNYKNNFTNVDVLRMKYLELMGQSAFDSIIEKSGELEIVPVDNGFTEKMLKEYNNGTLTDDEGVLKLLLEYTN